MIVYQVSWTIEGNTNQKTFYTEDLASAFVADLRRKLSDLGLSSIDPEITPIEVIK